MVQDKEKEGEYKQIEAKIRNFTTGLGLNYSTIDTPVESELHEHGLIFDKIKNELSKFGLTSNQSKVFLYLERYGSNTATQISKALKFPRTETYHVLTTLQHKGIVSASFQHPIKFTALPIDKAIEALINAEKERVKHLEKQEKSLVELLGALPSFKINKDEIKEGKFQLLQGTNQMSRKIKDMFVNAKNSIQVLASEKDFMKFYNLGYLELMRDSKAEIQLLSSTSDKTSYKFEDRLKKNMKNISMKIKEGLCFIITDNEQAILFMNNVNEPPLNMVAMWTDSDSMVYTLTLLFTYIWTNSNISLEFKTKPTTEKAEMTHMPYQQQDELNSLKPNIQLTGLDREDLPVALRMLVTLPNLLMNTSTYDPKILNEMLSETRKFVKFTDKSFQIDLEKMEFEKPYLLTYEDSRYGIFRSKKDYLVMCEIE